MDKVPKLFSPGLLLNDLPFFKNFPPKGRAFYLPKRGFPLVPASFFSFISIVILPVGRAGAEGASEKVALSFSVDGEAKSGDSLALSGVAQGQAWWGRCARDRVFLLHAWPSSWAVGAAEPSAPGPQEVRGCAGKRLVWVVWSTATGHGSAGSAICSRLRLRRSILPGVHLCPR